MATIALYPGTFDPITLGHADIAQRAAKLVDRLIIAVAEGVHKTPLLNLEQRIALVQAAFTATKNIEVCSFTGLLANFAAKKNARVIIRGLRSIVDYTYEAQLAETNKQLMPEIETLFLMPSSHVAHISATMVREIFRLNGNIQPFVPEVVFNKLQDLQLGGN